MFELSPLFKTPDLQFQFAASRKPGFPKVKHKTVIERNGRYPQAKPTTHQREDVRTVFASAVCHHCVVGRMGRLELLDHLEELVGILLSQRLIGFRRDFLKYRIAV